MTNNNPPQTTTYKYYWYDERAWHVPEGFVFPEDTKREVGFKLWMMGMPNYHSRNVEGNTEHSPVPPFRLLKPTFLPPEVSKKFKLHWRPLFLMMEEAFELDRNAQITAENVNEYYKAGDKHLRENWVSYVYNNKKYNPDNWKISTWSKYIERSYIEKHGSDSDRQNLPERSRYNRPHQGRKRRVQPKQNIRTRRRTNPRQRRGRGLNQDEQHVEDDAFAAAFQNIAVPPAALQRDLERRQETAEEAAQDLREAIANSRPPQNPNCVAISTEGLGQNSADAHYREWLRRNDFVNSEMELCTEN